MRNPRSLVVVVGAGLLLCYLGSYAGLRCQRALVRTGLFYNSRTETGALAIDAGWMRTDIVRPAGSTGSAWLQGVFWPLIAVEKVFWNSIGRQLRGPGPP